MGLTIFCLFFPPLRRDYKFNQVTILIISDIKHNFLCYSAALFRRPIKAALAATSEHVAGLLPLHLVYSQAHEAAIEVIELQSRITFSFLFCYKLDYLTFSAVWTFAICDYRYWYDGIMSWFWCNCSYAFSFLCAPILLIVEPQVDFWVKCGFRTYGHFSRKQWLELN